ncbi:MULTISPECIES: helix-turn-helix transcriptional regulator [unclassified Streptomyces]|uniref:helix-turn-helix transcriptional regulator n=1 Tax=unclassified Streptomyces TaxID=2593676 RepID=UPI0038107E26
MTHGQEPMEWEGDAVAWRNRTFLLFDRLPVPIALCSPNGDVLMANPAMAAEWGELPGRLRGLSALALFRTPGTDRFHAVAEAVRHGRRSRYPVEVSWSAAGGVERYGELTIDLLADNPAAHPVLLLVLRVGGERAAARPDPVAPDVRGGGASATEARILALVAGGRTTAQIARAVGLTVDGVTYHLGRISRRWGVGNRAALVARAYVTGVLAPGVWPPATAPGGQPGTDQRPS